MADGELIMDGKEVSKFGRVAAAGNADLIPLLNQIAYQQWGNATIPNGVFIAGGSMGDMGRDLAYAGVFTAPIAVFDLTPNATYRWIRGTQETATAWFFQPAGPPIIITHPGATGEAYDFVVPDVGWGQNLNRTPLEFFNVHGGPPPWNDPMNHKLIGLGGPGAVATRDGGGGNKFIEINGVRLYFGADNPPTFSAPAGSFYFSTAGAEFILTAPSTWALVGVIA